MVSEVGSVMQAEVSKRLLAHSGLPWEDGVLAFHATQRTVQTASLGQARPLQPGPLCLLLHRGYVEPRGGWSCAAHPMPLKPCCPQML